MFRGGRDFRLIAFTSEVISSSKEVIKKLPYANLSEPDELAPDDADYSFQHLFYYRENPYSPSHEELDGLITEHNGVKVYQYNLYIAQFRIPDVEIPLYIIAVPFTAMAVELFTLFNINAKGSKVTYLKINIEGLVKALKTGNLAGDLRLTKLELDIEGDAPTKSAVLAGSDVPNSMTYDSIISSLNNVTLTHKKCKLLYDDRTFKKVTIEADIYGNFVIPLHASGRNLPYVSTVLQFLSQLDVLIFNPILPSFRTLQE